MTDKPSQSPVLEYQLQMLRAEFDVINETIRAGDSITKSMKEWTITIWAASVGGALLTDKLHQFVGLTAVIPLLFWFVDIWHRVDQRIFIWRSMRIMDFLNDDRLPRSFEAGKFVDFDVLDVASRRERPPEYHDFTNWRRVMRFRTLSVFYGSLAAISLLLELGALLGWLNDA